MNDCVLVTDSGSIRLLTFNRPRFRNAINRATAFALAEALDDFDRQDHLRVAVLHGAGGNFCAGMDLKAFPSEGVPLVPGRGFGGITERSAEKPLIAAVEGYALAGGFEVALACDLIVAGSGARFGLPEVTRGLVAAAGGLTRLPRRLPYHLAMSLILTGDMLSAETAFRHGLVTNLCEDGAALDQAQTLAATIAANAPLAVRASKAVVSHGIDWPQTEAFQLQAELTDPVFVSEDAHEGAMAFAERRAPHWIGR